MEMNGQLHVKIPPKPSNSLVQIFHKYPIHLTPQGVPTYRFQRPIM